MSNFRNLNKKILLTLFFVIIIVYFTNIETLLSEIKKINIQTFFLCLLIFLPHTLLYILKWFLIVKNFYKGSFKTFLKSMSKAIFLSEITQSSFVLELAKFFYLGKIKAKTKIILILNDKLITLLTKALMLSFAILFFLFFNDNAYIYLNYILIYGSIVLLVCLIIISFFLNQKKYILKLKKIYNKFFSQKIFSRKIVISLEILRNLQFIGIYYLSITNFFDYQIILPYILFVPIFELLIRLQIFSAIGSREFLFLLIGFNIDLSNEQLIASSFIITSVTFLTSMLNYFIISQIFGFTDNKKFKVKNKINTNAYNKTLVYAENNKAGGAIDILTQFQYYNKLSKNFVFNKDLDSKYKNIVLIDNFINIFYFFKVLFFLKSYKGKKFLVCTEFITKKDNHISFNYFDKNKPQRHLIVNLSIYIYFKFISIFRYINYEQKKQIMNLRFLIYYKLRFLTFKIISRYINNFIIVHKNINLKIINISNNRIIELPLYVDTKKLKKNLNKNIHYKFSGYLTNFRYDVLKTIIQKNKKKIKINLSKRKINKFIKTSNNKKNMEINFYIEKEKNWPYSSPMGYINLIHKGHIAMTLRKFKDYYSDLLAINYSLLNVSSANIKKIITLKVSKIARYNLRQREKYKFFKRMFY